jgi:hypothetical protein
MSVGIVGCGADNLLVFYVVGIGIELVRALYYLGDGQVGPLGFPLYTTLQ